MIPLQMQITGPHESRPGERVKIYVSFENPIELQRGINIVRGLGGTTFLGVSTEKRSGKTFAVFESENDASKLMADVVKRGIRVLSVVVKGSNYIRGLTPMVVQCEGCGADLLYETHFSKTGVQFCDGCLAKLIEEPVEKEDEHD